MVKIKNEKNVNWFNQILSEVFVHVKGHPTCKYFPTCSQYAIEALEKYGVIKVASWLYGEYLDVILF